MRTKLRNSMRAVMSFVLAVLLAVSVGAVRADHPNTVVVESVRVFTSVTDARFRCTAVMVEEGIALTAGHCADQIENAAVIIDGAPHLVTKIVKPVAGVDFAILAVPGAPCPCATDSDALAAEGELLHTVSFPRGQLLIAGGPFMGRAPVMEDGQIYGLVFVATAPGSSGGGVFNARGELIGIITATNGIMTAYIELGALGL